MPRACAILLLAGIALASLHRRRPVAVHAEQDLTTWVLPDGTTLHLSPTVH